MKKNKFYVNALWIITIAVILCTGACKGPQGEIGPQGAAGTPGVKGDQGIQGVPGVTGKPGTANIIVSPWHKVPDSTWKSGQDSSYFEVSFADTNITQKVLDQALVMAYYRNFGRESIVFPLPAVNEELSLGFYLQMDDNKGSMNFDLLFFKPRTEPIDFDLEFRWIIIPNNNGGRLKSSDLKDYLLTKKIFGIVD